MVNFREIARSMVLTTSGRFRKPRKGVHILNGHFASRNSDTDKAPFTTLLKKLRMYSEFLDIEEAVDLVKSGDASSFQGVGIAFTFDDGLADCHSVIAPVLQEFGVNACFFVNPGFVSGDDLYASNFLESVIKTPNRRPLTWQQIKDLHSAGFVIGNHTFDHVRLSEVDQADLNKQIVESKQYLEQKINANVEYFAWPYGAERDISKDALSVACQTHKNVFSGFGFRQYLSFNGQVLNRRHFEADWSVEHMRHFLSFTRTYN